MTPTPDPKPLLPCPFCGSEDYTVALYNKACATCKCGAFGPDVEWSPDEPQQAVFDRAYAAWNTRPQPDQPSRPSDERLEWALSALRMAYRKHHMGDEEIGWEELSEHLQNTICNIVGDDQFQAFIDSK